MGEIDCFVFCVFVAEVPLTIRDKMLRHMQGNLDSEGAGILRSIDNGNDTCADGNQRQGDLIQRTVLVA